MLLRHRAVKPKWGTAVGKRLDTRLSEEDKLALEQVYKKSPDWRARERAKTVLLLGQGLLPTVDRLPAHQTPSNCHRINPRSGTTSDAGDSVNSLPTTGASWQRVGTATSMVT